MQDRVGQQIGNYRLVKLLGIGAFASVYLAQHTYLPRQAAIKVLHFMDQVNQKNFLEEARIIAGLTHQNIVQILDFGLDGATPYLVMTYAPEGTLRSKHPRGTNVALDVIVNSYLKQIAEVLQCAHDQNIIHRDVKPENVLVSEDNHLFLSDFGIAVIAQQTTLLKTGGYAGTVSYSAPEQLVGKTRKESDQYAVAVMVYEWMCGRLPFTGNTQPEIMLKHLQEAPPPFGPNVKPMPDVEAVVMKALSKEPKERFGSVLEFYQALVPLVSKYMQSVVIQTAEPVRVNVAMQTTVRIDQRGTVDQLFDEMKKLAHEHRYSEALELSNRLIGMEVTNEQLIDCYLCKLTALDNLQRHEEAETTTSKVLELHLSTEVDCIMRLRRGEGYHMLQQYNAAMKAFKRSLRLAKSPEVRFMLYMRRGITLVSIKNYEEARKSFLEAVRIWEAQNQNQDLLLKLGKHEETLSALNELIEQAGSKLIKADLDRLYELKRRLQEILDKKQLASAVMKQPEKEDQSTGNTKKKKGKTNTDAKKAESGNASTIVALMAQTKEHLRQERFGDAMAAVNQCLGLGPVGEDLIACYISKADASRGLRLYDLAIDSYNQALKLDPTGMTRYNAYVQLGSAFHLIGKYEEAIHVFDCAIDFTPNESPAYIGKGVVLVAMKRHEEALDIYEQSIRAIGTRGIDAYWRKADLLLMLGRHAEGLSTLDVLLQRAQVNQLSASGFQRIYELRLRLLMALGRLEEALSVLNVLLNTNPTQHLYKAKSNVLKSLGRDAEAQVAKQKANQLSKNFSN